MPGCPMFCAVVQQFVHLLFFSIVSNFYLQKSPSFVFNLALASAASIHDKIILCNSFIR